MEPPPSAHPINIILKLLSACSPELVKHIFSFTTRDHASAAGLFDLATHLPPDRVATGSPFFFPPSLPEQAITKGDLPLLRYLLNTPHRNCPWNFLGQTHSHWPVGPHNLHSYMYIHTLLDVSSPLLSTTTAPTHHLATFDKLHTWATLQSPARTDILDRLHASNLAARARPDYADWDTVVVTRNLTLLRHARENSFLDELPDNLLRAACRSGWFEGIECLARWFPRAQPAPDVVFAAIRDNDAARLACLVERFSTVVAEVEFCDVCREIDEYYLRVRQANRRPRSILEVVRILDATSAMREQQEMAFGRRVVLAALEARDFRMMAWAIEQGERYHFKAVDLEKWRDSAAEVGSGAEELVEKLDVCLRRRGEVRQGWGLPYPMAFGQ
ncbi:hypothetical protein BC938DRAFT_478456 [Jimgerdemannia flammicorona]|uniref:Uncharacterized protein n=1 Tax=Jimgerdemannia flammicorona TaxID=994334 RepID=A0A433QMW5_9FUNG|nr:hypothetical protein BC938DRAFT_478456 [Jimgerdemannia flammicorona]